MSDCSKFQTGSLIDFEAFCFALAVVLKGTFIASPGYSSFEQLIFQVQPSWLLQFRLSNNVT